MARVLAAAPDAVIIRTFLLPADLAPLFRRVLLNVHSALCVKRSRSRTVFAGSASCAHPCLRSMPRAVVFQVRGVRDDSGRGGGLRRTNVVPQRGARRCAGGSEYDAQERFAFCVLLLCIPSIRFPDAGLTGACAVPPARQARLRRSGRRLGSRSPSTWAPSAPAGPRRQSQLRGPRASSSGAAAAARRRASGRRSSLRAAAAARAAAEVAEAAERTTMRSISWQRRWRSSFLIANG